MGQFNWLRRVLSILYQGTSLIALHISYNNFVLFSTKIAFTNFCTQNRTQTPLNIFKITSKEECDSRPV